MHEPHIAKSILETALKNAPKNAKLIKKINIIAGMMSHIEKEGLEPHFREIAKGTIAQDALLYVRKEKKLSENSLGVTVENIEAIC